MIQVEDSKDINYRISTILFVCRIQVNQRHICFCRLFENLMWLPHFWCCQLQSWMHVRNLYKMRCLHEVFCTNKYFEHWCFPIMSSLVCYNLLWLCRSVCNMNNILCCVVTNMSMTYWLFFCEIIPKLYSRASDKITTRSLGTTTNHNTTENWRRGIPLSPHLPQNEADLGSGDVFAEEGKTSKLLWTWTNTSSLPPSPASQRETV